MEELERMLTGAYEKLGIADEATRRALVAAALGYLSRDREFYIEAAEPDVPEYEISVQHGVTCRLIPLAWKKTTEERENHLRETTKVLSLMVTREQLRYVCGETIAQFHEDPRDNSYRYPLYRYVGLEELPEGLQVLPPQEIRPAATTRDREVYDKILAAFTKLGGYLDPVFIPHKAERAMLAVQYAPCDSVEIQGKILRGKLISLARDQSLWEEYRKDHKYSYIRELMLLISGNELRYLLKTTHIYDYFRKVVIDPAPGGCIYDPAGQKQETTYAFADLDQIQERMHLLYH